MGYIPYWNNPPSQSTLVLRTERDSSLVASALRQAVWDVDAGVPVPTVTTFADVLKTAVAPKPVPDAPGGLVRDLCAAARQSRHLRVSLPSPSRAARRSWAFAWRSVPGPVLSSAGSFARGWRRSSQGLALGLAGALAAGRLIQGLLYDVSASEPGAYVVVFTILAIVASVACYLPARRIMRIDPVQALRWE
jgi:putative ABC transport system permease protein